jgi:hypothetical protein
MDHIHVCRYGHDLGHTLHFHVVPIYRWVKDAYARTSSTRDGSIQYPDFIDGHALNLFVSEELRVGAERISVVGPGVEEVIRALRTELGHAVTSRLRSGA